MNSVASFLKKYDKWLPWAGVIFLIALIALGRFATVSAFSGGTGAWDDPYVITTCDELESISSSGTFLAANFILGNDIDCSGAGTFDRIGSTTTSFFSGRFDGDGHTISNVTINSPSADNVGIFGYVQGGVIRNLTVDNITIEGRTFVGAVVGRLQDGALIGVNITNSDVYSTSAWAGGAVGQASWGYLYGIDITDTDVGVTRPAATTTLVYAGGIIGRASDSRIANSHSGATVEAYGTGTGGIAGTTLRDVEIVDSYFDGTVLGITGVGGIVGAAEGISTTYRLFIRRTYSSGSVISTTTSTSATLSAIGGIIGWKKDSQVGIRIQQSFVNGPVSSTTYAGAISGNAAAISDLTGVYYATTTTTRSSCLGAGTATTSQCFIDNTSGYFESSSNAPLSSWDFTNDWVTQPSDEPALIAFSEPVSATSVGTCADLATAFGNNPNGWYSLSTDIDCAGSSALMPFSTTSGKVFTGRLDGAGYTISGIARTPGAVAADDTPDHYGLFRVLYGAVIENVSLAGTGINASSYWQVGGIAGLAAGTVISNVHSTVPVIGSDYAVGGFVGYAGSVYIIDSTLTADVTSTQASFPNFVGGLVGLATYVHAENTYYAGTVLGGGSAGGIVGSSGAVYFDTVGTSGTLSGIFQLGGLTGISGMNERLSTMQNASSSMSIVFDDNQDTYSQQFGVLGGSIGNTNFENVEASGSIDVSNLDGADTFGGMFGEIGGFGTNTFVNATSTVDLLLEGTSGNFNWSDFGGIVGSADSYSFDNVNMVADIQVGSDLTPADFAQSFGGIVGNGSSLEIANSSFVGTLSVTGGASGVCCGGTIAGTLLTSTTTGIAHDVDIDIDLTGDVWAIGSLVGYADNSSVFEDVQATGTLSVIAPTPHNIGGLFGELYDSIVTLSFSDVNLAVTAGPDASSVLNNIGGFAGYASDVTIADAYSRSILTLLTGGDTTATSTGIGGFIGQLDGNNTVTEAYASGPMTLTASSTGRFGSIGGFIGSSLLSTSVIENDFSAGPMTIVSGSENIGAFIGTYHGSETFANNAYDAARTTLSLCTGEDLVDPAWCSAENVGNAAPTYFYTQTNEPLDSWDFATIWNAHADDYPTLEGGSGGGAVAPTVTTDTASSVTDTAATLNGNITAIGSDTPTARGFAYGLTTAYGATTTEAGSFSTGAYTAAAASLTCNTTYHVRAYATSPDGTGYGSDDTFTTAVCSSGGGGGSSSGGSSRSGSGPGRDITPPGITNVKGQINPGSGTVTISWDTDEPATTQVEYGPTACLGLATEEIDTGSKKKLNHSVTLPAAACTSSARFSVISADADGNRRISAGHSNNVLLCPPSAPAPAPELLICSVDTAVPSAPTPSVPATVPAIPTTEPIPGVTTPIVIVNEGEEVTDARVVPVEINPPIDAVTIVLLDPEQPESAVTLPATETTTVWDLCTGSLECPDGEYILGVYFIDRDGSRSPTITTRLRLEREEDAVPAPLIEDGNFSLAALGAAIDRGLRAAAVPLMPLGVTAGTMIALWHFATGAKRVADIPTLAYRGITAFFTFGYLRRKKRAWGTVYDSKTRRPLDPAVVTLYDESGKVVKTAITDLDGRFAFLANPGTYSITAEKGHHSFPAKQVAEVDPLYPNPYLGGSFMVGNEGVIIKDIPLDPVDFDWNEEEKHRRGLYQFFSRFDRPLAYAALIITPIGALLSLYEVATAPSALNIAFLALYVLIGVLYLSGLGPRLYGALRDTAGLPLAYATVKAFPPGATSSGIHTVSDNLGRYYLLLPKGDSFDIQVEERTGDAAYTPVLRKRFSGLNGHFNKSLRVS